MGNGPSELVCHLLNQSVAEKMRFFDEKFVSHRLLEKARDELMDAISAMIPLIFLLGCPGVGKTTLLTKLDEKMKREAAHNPRFYQDRPNIYIIEIIANGFSKFNTRDFYKRIIRGLHESFPGLRVDYSEEENIYYNNDAKLVIRERITEPALRRCFEKTVQAVNLVAIVFEEAPHFVTLTPGTYHLSLMNWAKSLASTTHISYIFVGTYELVEFLDKSAQLARRSQIVHFERYKADIPKEFADFEDTLFTFQKSLPLDKEPDLMKHLNEFYAGSLGCVGILKDWLYRSVDTVLRNNKQTLSWSHIKRYGISTGRLIAMMEKIDEQETELKQYYDEDSRNALFELLKLPSHSKNGTATSQPTVKTAPSSRKTRKRSSPRKRRAKRRPVGNKGKV